MSSKDKTREKLMGSMRKTKADAGIGTASKTEPVASQTTPEPAKSAPQKASRTQSPQPQRVSSDGYQSGRRVWPD